VCRSPWQQKRILGLGVVGICIFGLGPGCTNDGQQQADAPRPAVTTNAEPQSPPVATDSPSGGLFSGTTAPVEQRRPTLDPVVLRDVRAAAQDTFDRVVFEFQTPSVSGYAVAYAEDPARECGSGDAVNVEGAVQLIVRLSPAQAHTEEGTITAKEHERHLMLPVLRELEMSCDFEGEVSWVLGLSARRPYRVTELAAPPRLVVDIQH
jgi:hypothetical protein